MATPSFATVLKYWGTDYGDGKDKDGRMYPILLPVRRTETSFWLENSMNGDRRKQPNLAVSAHAAGLKSFEYPAEGLGHLVWDVEVQPHREILDRVRIGDLGILQGGTFKAVHNVLSGSLEDQVLESDVCRSEEGALDANAFRLFVDPDSKIKLVSRRNSETKRNPESERRLSVQVEVEHSENKPATLTAVFPARRRFQLNSSTGTDVKALQRRAEAYIATNQSTISAIDRKDLFLVTSCSAHKVFIAVLYGYGSAKFYFRYARPSGDGQDQAWHNFFDSSRSGDSDFQVAGPTASSASMQQYFIQGFRLRPSLDTFDNPSMPATDGKKKKLPSSRIGACFERGREEVWLESRLFGRL